MAEATRDATTVCAAFEAGFVAYADGADPSLKFALCRSRIGRSGAGFRGLVVAVYWTRAGAVPSRSKALSWSGVGLAERVIVAFGA
jgi:hypothetical protein